LKFTHELSSSTDKLACACKQKQYLLFIFKYTTETEWLQWLFTLVVDKLRNSTSLGHIPTSEGIAIIPEIASKSQVEIQLTHTQSQAC